MVLERNRPPHRQPAGWAAIYVRISEDRADTGLGTARQEADCRDLCLRRGYTDDRVRVHEDNDTSAYSGKPRHGYERMLSDIAAGEITFLTAWHPDRLYRSLTELEHFIGVIEAAGIAGETSRAGPLELWTPSGRMIARQLGVYARYESEHKADRQRRKHQELADAGKVSGGGTRPFGFNDDRRTLHVEEAERVREAAGRVLDGESLRSVCRDFTARGISTVTGGPWAPTVLRNLLISARISGRREHGRRDAHRHTILAPIACATADWAPIITREQSDALRALLTSPSRRKNMLTGRSYLLRGVARCRLCGKSLVARPRADKRRSYVCASGPGFNGCGKIRILADELEQDVSERLLAAIDEGELDATLSAADGSVASAARDEVVRAEERLTQLSTEYARGDITDPEWRAMRPELVRRQQDAQHRYDRARGKRFLAGLPRPLTAAWGDFNFGQRRGTVVDLVAEVRVGSAIRGLNQYDPRRVSIIWKV